MDWFILVIAGLCEVAFASCLGKAKQAVGTEVYLWYGGFLLALTISMVLLVKAAQTLPIGTAYAVWTGKGQAERRQPCWQSTYPNDAAPPKRSHRTFWPRAF
jgi:multidrug transporter EmrE-like cation transporter